MIKTFIEHIPDCDLNDLFTTILLKLLVIISNQQLKWTIKIHQVMLWPSKISNESFG